MTIKKEQEPNEEEFVPDNTADTDVLQYREYVAACPLNITSGLTLFSSLKEIENKIAEAIDNIAIKGMIVGQDGTIRAKLDDIKKAVQLIEGLKKNAQANLENMELALKNDDIQSAWQFQLTPDQEKGQFEVAPGESQQIGKMENETPAEFLVPTAAIENRFIRLSEILIKLNNS